MPFVFQGSGTVRIKPGLEDFDEPNDFIVDHTKASCSKIFICTDINDPNFHSGSPKPYLAVVDRIDTDNEELKYLPDKSLYKEINLSHPSHIEISFQSDDNYFLPLSKNLSTVVLTFERLGLV